MAWRLFLFITVITVHFTHKIQDGVYCQIMGTARFYLLCSLGNENKQRTHLPSGISVYPPDSRVSLLSVSQKGEAAAEEEGHTNLSTHSYRTGSRRTLSGLSYMMERWGILGFGASCKAGSKMAGS